MTIEKVLNGENAKIIVVGRLDTQTAPDLEKEIDNVVSNLKELVFDMTGLEYISSAGLRVVLKLKKIMDRVGTLEVINPNELVLEVFEITGFSALLGL